MRKHKEKRNIEQKFQNSFSAMMGPCSQSCLRWAHSWCPVYQPCVLHTCPSHWLVGSWVHPSPEDPQKGLQMGPPDTCFDPTSFLLAQASPLPVPPSSVVIFTR